MGRNVTQIKKRKRQARYQKRRKERLKAARTERTAGKKKKVETGAKTPAAS